jgi:NTE family protein
MNFYNPKVLSPDAAQVVQKVKQPENLVFSGGGIKGLAYAGVIKALEEKQLMKNIKCFAGASAGAITAALLAVGMNSSEIQKEMSEVNFETFLKESKVDIEAIMKDPKQLLHWETVWNLISELFGYFGLCNASKFAQWLTLRFNAKGFNENTTFKELYDKTGNNLSIVLCNANYSKTVIANHTNEDLCNMPVVTAVRGSMSIPFVYKPLKWKNSHGEEDVYMDGGTMYNYPIEVFDNDQNKDKTLGFILATEKIIFDPPRRNDDNILSHLACIYDSIMNVANEYCFRSGNQNRTVFIDTMGIGVLDFDLPLEKKKLLVDNGYQATIDYFKP